MSIISRVIARFRFWLKADHIICIERVSCKRRLSMTTTHDFMQGVHGIELPDGAISSIWSKIPRILWLEGFKTDGVLHGQVGSRTRAFEMILFIHDSVIHLVF